SSPSHSSTFCASWYSQRASNRFLFNKDIMRELEKPTHDPSVPWSYHANQPAVSLSASGFEQIAWPPAILPQSLSSPIQYCLWPLTVSSFGSKKVWYQLMPNVTGVGLVGAVGRVKPNRSTCTQSDG